jgi:hypothetical protein
MRDLVQFIRWIAGIGVILSIPALGLGLFGLYQGLAPGVGDGGMGDLIATGVGIFFTIVGSAGIVFGGLLFMLSKRALAARADVTGTRRMALFAGIGILLLEVVISSAIGGVFVSLVALGAALGLGFLVVAVSSAARRDALWSGVLAALLIATGAFTIWGQVATRGAVGG